MAAIVADDSLRSISRTSASISSDLSAWDTSRNPSRTFLDSSARFFSAADIFLANSASLRASRFSASKVLCSASLSSFRLSCLLDPLDRLDDLSEGAEGADPANITARSRADCDVHHHSPPSAKGSLGASMAMAAESSLSASAARASVCGENGLACFSALCILRRSRAARSLSLPPELPGVAGVGTSSPSSTIAILFLAGVTSGSKVTSGSNVTRLPEGVDPCAWSGDDPSSGGNGGGKPRVDDSTPARYESRTSPERIPSALRLAASLAANASPSKEPTAATTASASAASRAAASMLATAASCAAVVSSPAASPSVVSPISSSEEEKSSDEV